ncbi:MAG: hypothetical protein ACRDA8_18700 [Shewanella sp.]
MEYEQLSREAKAVLKTMVEYCLNNNVCMGMDEGFKKDGRPRSFRKQLREFVAGNDNH